MLVRHIRLLLVVLVAGLSGCLGTRARRASSEGDHLQAAILHDQAYARYDLERSRKRRDAARTRAVEASLAEIDRLHRHGAVDDARYRLDRLLRHAYDWERPFTAAEVAEVDRLVTWVARLDHHRPLVLLDQGHPLDALLALPQPVALLEHPTYARVREGIVEAIEAAGKQRCGQLQESAGWARGPDLVAVYCRAFHADVAPGQQPVAACDRVEIITNASELPADEREGLQQDVRALLGRTPYLHPRGDCAIEVRLSASRTLRTTKTPVVEVVEWTERVPYTERVPKTEHYDEWETRTETRYVSERYTVTEYRRETCGHGDHQYSCSRPHSVTRQRSVPKRETRRVLVHKTRRVWVDEVRYRSVPRSRTYEALRVVHTFEGSGRLVATLPTPAATLELPWSSRHVSEGLEHQQTLVEAGLLPSSAPAPARQSLVELDLSALHDAWFDMIGPRLEAELCHGGADLDLATACLLYVGPEAVPAAGRDALASAMGDGFESLAWVTHPR